MLLATPDAGDVLGLFGVERAADAHPQQLGVSTDGIEWSAQLVTHAGEEFRFRLTGGERFFFGSLALLDVDADSEPRVDFPRFVAAGTASREEPTVSSVQMAQPQLGFVILASLHGGLPAPDGPVTVVGVDGVGPAVTQRLCLGKTRVVVPVVIAIGELAIGLGEPDDLGGELEQVFESASGGDGPPFEPCRGENDGEKQDADD